MKRYFVKSLFYGWNEVNKENYDRFIKHIRNSATNFKSKEAIETYIKSRTRIEEN